MNQPIHKLLAVSEFISKDKFREVLQQIHFKKDYIEATNGYALIRVKADDAIPEEMMVPAESIKQAKDLVTIKNLPIEISKGEVRSHAGVVNYSAPSGDFPDTDRVVKEVGDKHSRVGLDIQYLELVCKAAKRLGINHVTLSVEHEVGKASLQPIRIDSQDKQMTAIIMPVRLSEEE